MLFEAQDKKNLGRRNQWGRRDLGGKADSLRGSWEVATDVRGRDAALGGGGRSQGLGQRVADTVKQREARML